MRAGDSEQMVTGKSGKNGQSLVGLAKTCCIRPSVSRLVTWRMELLSRGSWGGHCRLGHQPVELHWFVEVDIAIGECKCSSL